MEWEMEREMRKDKVEWWGERRDWVRGWGFGGRGWGEKWGRRAIPHYL